MEKIRKISIFILVVILYISGLNGCKKIDKDPSLKIIFDTDIGNDIDDVLALQMLMNFHNSSEVDLIGITISKSNPYTIEYVDGFCRYHRVNDIPIGYVYEGPNNNAGKYLGQTLDTIINGKPILNPKVSARDFVLDAWELQRKLLSEVEDSSVVMISVGPLTNLRRLLESTSDQYSSLNGIELVKKKVRFLSLMGGEFSNVPDFTEWNIEQDIESAIIIFEYWPTHIIASGWEVGSKLLYPHESILEDFKNSHEHPLCISYNLYEEMPYDRPTWDLTSVLYAVENNHSFRLSPKGKIGVNESGNTKFETQVNGNHQYLIIDEEQVELTRRKLVEAVTKENRKN